MRNKVDRSSQGSVGSWLEVKRWVSLTCAQVCWQSTSFKIWDILRSESAESQNVHFEHAKPPQRHHHSDNVPWGSPAKSKKCSTNDVDSCLFFLKRDKPNVRWWLRARERDSLMKIWWTHSRSWEAWPQSLDPLASSPFYYHLLQIKLLQIKIIKGKHNSHLKPSQLVQASAVLCVSCTSVPKTTFRAMYKHHDVPWVSVACSRI
jgi:hypothetical protein